jgi:large subunit ribosomal protein L23
LHPERNGRRTDHEEADRLWEQEDLSVRLLNHISADDVLTGNSPRFTIALKRSRHLSPYHARFLVPLDFSKYDLRDYLYHAYNVKCFNIRSYVKQMPVRDTREQQRHFFRPESKKYMTVEMEEPFVWPELPNLEPWGVTERKKEEKEALLNNGVEDKNEQREAARSLRKQVQMLFKKEEVTSTDQLIQRKKAADIPLTKEEQTRLDKMSERKKELSKLSSLDLWAQRRTGKVVEGDERGKYAIKA